MCLTSSSASDAVMRNRRSVAQIEPARSLASASVTDFGLGNGWVPSKLRLDPSRKDNQIARISLGKYVAPPQYFQVSEICVLLGTVGGGREGMHMLFLY